MTWAPASVVVLAWLALASPAAALEAVPFELADPGERPSVAVDNKGNAHFVWNESRDDAPDVTHYCKVLAGGTECKIERRFAPRGNDPADNADPDGPRVLVRRRLVVVVTHRCCGGFGPSPATACSRAGPRTVGGLSAPRSSSETAAWRATRSGSVRRLLDDLRRRGGRHLLPGTQVGRDRGAEREPGRRRTPPRRTAARSRLLDDDNVLATFDDLDHDLLAPVQRQRATQRHRELEPDDGRRPGPGGPAGGRAQRALLLYARTEGSGDATLCRARVHGHRLRHCDRGRGDRSAGDSTFPDFFQDAAGRLHAVWVAQDGALMYRRSDDAKTYRRTTQLIGPSSDTATSRWRPARTATAGSSGTRTAPGGRVRAAALHVDPDPPVVGKTVTVTVVKGDVLIKLPGKSLGRLREPGQGPGVRAAQRRGHDSGAARSSTPPRAR